MPVGRWLSPISPSPVTRHQILVGVDTGKFASHDIWSSSVTFTKIAAFAVSYLPPWLG